MPDPTPSTSLQLRGGPRASETSSRTVPNRPSKTGAMTTPSCAAPVKPTETPERRPVGRGAVEDGQTPSHVNHVSARSNTSRLTEKQKQGMLLPEQSEGGGQVQPKESEKNLAAKHTQWVPLDETLTACVRSSSNMHTGSHQTSRLSGQCAGNTGIQ